MRGELKRISKHGLKPMDFGTLLGEWSPGETHKRCPKSDTRPQAGFATAPNGQDTGHVHQAHGCLSGHSGLPIIAFITSPQFETADVSGYAVC
jgi:hypothetical protein